MRTLVFDLQEIDKTIQPLAGGKGSNLGEVTHIEGIRVPEGFCISTEAFDRMIASTSQIHGLLDQLLLPGLDNRDQILSLSAAIRGGIEAAAIPQAIQEEIKHFLRKNDPQAAYAVRSSATAEDLLMNSFAGQHDTYLNITGEAAILRHVSKCWASLFTERAIVYRLRNGFDHRKIGIAVVVQKMVFPYASGIVFTADPLSSNRKVSSIEACFGLGEALVSGLMNADHYRVRDGRVIDRRIASNKLAIHASKNGGTEQVGIEPEQRNRPVLTDGQVLELERMGRKIEAHFCVAQDIEWCLADDVFYVVQSRPITTLFPIPEAGDEKRHVYISVGHQQMMTDAMKPLGISLWQMIAMRPMFKAGGRLFVDVTRQLSSTGSRAALMNAMGSHDPLLKDALVKLIERGDFIEPQENDSGASVPAKAKQPITPPGAQASADIDPAIVSELIRETQASVEVLKQDIRTKSGTDLVDFIQKDIGLLKKMLVDPRNAAALEAAMDAASWINENMMVWLGEKNAADTLSQSVPDNITSGMGLALLDVADAIRPYPEIIKRLQDSSGDDFLNELQQPDGGGEVREAIQDFLSKYGMRCAGEIDVTRPRWSERPATLIPLILSNIKNFEPGAGTRRFEQGLQEALSKEEDLLARLGHLHGGEEKAEQAKQKIRQLRNFSGYREYPKYGIVSRTILYKQALLTEAEKLAGDGLIREPEDAYYLTFEEFREVASSRRLDYQLILERKLEHHLFEKLHPPRVITSEGEIVTGAYRREGLPATSLPGLAVSSGVAEGRARVILSIEDADIEDGDILVTTFTDPSWTPVFVSIKALVTEVGGLMTHGAVIAREYGLPAVVGVEDATRLIRDGQRIRVHGTDGYVEIL